MLPRQPWIVFAGVADELSVKKQGLKSGVVLRQVERGGDEADRGNGGCMAEKIIKIVSVISRGMEQRKRHYTDHPLVIRAAEEVVSLLNDYWLARGVAEISIRIADTALIDDGMTVYGPIAVPQPLAQMIKSLGCSGISLKKGVSTADFKKFFDISVLRSPLLRSIGDAQQFFDSCHINNIKVIIRQKEDTRRIQAVGPRKNEYVQQQAALFYQPLADIVAHCFSQAGEGKPLALAKVRTSCVSLLEAIKSHCAEAMQYMAYSDTRRYTIAHSLRVAALALHLGVCLKWSHEDLLATGRAALLHDIGMSRIPWPILEQGGPLSEEEWRHIFDHPRHGLEMLMSQSGISECDLAGCWGHHQRFDGGGYPPLPGWAEHHPVAMLLHVCDVFEALTAPRPYQRLLAPKDAYRLMKDDRGSCDPKLLAALVASLGLYPPGSYVRLSDKRLGVVMAEGAAIDRPLLKIISTAFGEPLFAHEQYELALEAPNHEQLSVEELLLGYAG